MEKYAAKCKNQNFMLKLSLYLHLGFCQVFQLLFVNQSFQGSPKIELKTQLLKKTRTEF